MDKNNWNFGSNSYTFNFSKRNSYFYVFATDYADNNSEDKNVQKQ